MRIILAISLYFAIALCESVLKDELDVIIQKYIEVQQKNIHSLIKKQAAGEDNEDNRIKDSFEFSIQIPAPKIDNDLIENTVVRKWKTYSRRPWGWWWLTTKVPTTEGTTRSTTTRSTRFTTRRTTRATTSRSTTTKTSRSTTRKRTTSRKTTQTPEATQTSTLNQDIPTTSKRTTYSHSKPSFIIRTTTKRRTTTTFKPIDDIYDFVDLYDWVTKDSVAMNLNQNKVY